MNVIKTYSYELKSLNRFSYMSWESKQFRSIFFQYMSYNNKENGKKAEIKKKNYYILRKNCVSA